MGVEFQEADRPLKKNLSDLNGLEDHGGINQLDPQIPDLFQVSKLGSPRLHLENNCLFVLEFNLRKLLNLERSGLEVVLANFL